MEDYVLNRRCLKGVISLFGKKKCIMKAIFLNKGLMPKFFLEMTTNATFKQL